MAELKQSQPTALARANASNDRHGFDLAEKHLEPAMYGPADYVAYLRAQGLVTCDSVPPGILILYNESVYNELVSHELGTTLQTPRACHVPSRYSKKVGIIGGFGIGAARITTIIEVLIVLGARRFASVGTAGALNPSLEIGDVVLCDRALCDEGVSRNYLGRHRYVEASEGFVSQLKSALIGLSSAQGASWTTDAPFRETRAEVEAYRREGVLTVDMEAAALFSVAAYRHVHASAVLIVSDTLTNGRWEPGFHYPRVKSSLIECASAVLGALASNIAAQPEGRRSSIANGERGD